MYEILDINILAYINENGYPILHDLIQTKLFDVGPILSKVWLLCSHPKFWKMIETTFFHIILILQIYEILIY
jgi:hypothetical protein